MTANKGLAKAAYIYENRDQWAKDLKAKGNKIAGYFCCYPPQEIMAAVGYIPFRVLGDPNEPITEADNYMPQNMCSFYRSCLDLAMKGRYDYLDAFVGCHACDAAERVSHIWVSYIKYKCSFYLDIPHTTHKAAMEFFRKQLGYMKGVFEEASGKKIDNALLNEKIELYNKQRRLVHQLHNLRKADPPPVSGTEVLQLMVAIMSTSAEEGNAMLEEAIEEIKARTPEKDKKKKRVLIWGSLTDNTDMIKLIEDCGLDVVMDDTGIGSRSYGHLDALTGDPLADLADLYLDKQVCPRTFRETGRTRDEDLENRFGYLSKFIKEWKIDGVIANVVRNCDIHGYEIPEVKYYMEKLVPVLVIERDYSSDALAPLRTRFQAFAESLE